MTEGRSCPLDYRYDPASLCRQTAPVTEDVLYIIGGLYGNPYALDEIERMAHAEEQQGLRVRLVFNGDFNWFNVSSDLFIEINRRVLEHTVSLGNVDYELARPTPGAGCGCAYPDFVGQEVVARSNQIITRLQSVAAEYPDIRQRLSLLPRYRCLIFGGLKILVLHGDPESLAGWGLAHEAFADDNTGTLRRWFDTTGADLIASTHTCLPVLWRGVVQGRPRAVVNNGSAGMGNLLADPRGLITRLGVGRPAAEPVASAECAGLNVSLLPVAFDQERWLRQFDRLWPAGSAAALSYRQRMASGTELRQDRVVFPTGS